jgi:hypothetical protein
MRKLSIAVTLAAVAAVSVGAQQSQTPAPTKPASSMAPANPITHSMNGYYGAVKGWVTMAAEQMPATDYAFKPATMPASDHKDIRTFGEIVGHVAFANFLFCGIASGMKTPADMTGVDKWTAKADLQKGLAASFEFCDKAWAATTDRNGATATQLPEGMGTSTRLATLALNTSHDAEHYGNIVTYFRAKGMVPPSSQPGK